MKYGISRYGKYFSAFMVLALGACTMDNGDESPLVEFGTVQSEFTVNATAGHVDIEVLSNQDCRLSFLDETTWAELSTSLIRGDGKFFIDYDDNDGFPRMTRVLVAAEQSGRCDTVLLKQRGGITPTMTLPSSSLIIPGSASGFSDTELQTNIDFSEVEISMSYTSGEGVDWVEGVSYADGRLTVDYLENPSATQPRSASVTLAYDNGWGEIQTTTLYLIQKTSEDELGQEASFEDVRSFALMGASVEIEDFLIISGYVVSDKESRNAGENPKTTYTSIDYTMCEKTVYLESLDGRYGFCLETATEADNIFERYDKVQLLLAGATLTGAENPDRYTISGITTSMVGGRETGSPSAIPVKEKYIAELTDDDIYTFVTLKDCEFPIRKGSLTPVHEGYTLGDAKAMMSKYPRLIRDIQGSSMYLYTNTTCPYRRTGKRLPYGSGNISGVVVFEYYQPYMYGDGIDADTHGRIGRYQLRHMAYEDIRFAEEESFSALLTEYRYIKDKAKDTDGYVYWYPTYGNNGRFTHSYQAYEAGCTGATTWNYLGPVGTAKGTEPFREYKRLRPRFKDADTSRLTLSAKAEYAYYKQMERAARLDTYIKFTEYQRIRSDAFRICDSLMRLKYGDRETTVADFQRLELADTTGLALPLSIAASTPVMFTPDMPWHEALEKIDSEYRLSAVRVASLDSLNDDPHIKLGNRPDDFRNFRYGNNLIGDDPYHGTMVAGVIAACAATAGELPRPVKILSVRAIPEGDEYDRDVAAAIRYAVDNGAEVVNMSFGKYLSPHRDEVLAAMKYARSKDVLLVMASGNDGVNVDVRPIFPTCRDTKGRRLENQIVVGASTPDGRVASFSNYGAENVDLLAPGENVRSTAPEGGYDTAQGTSIAAPIVSGVAAVLRSFYPDLSAREIREILIRTVTHFPADEMPVPGKSETSRMIQGRQVCLGGGILNAQAAMKEASKISKFGER